MTSVDADRNLLFGVLALQGELIDSAQFAEICTAWSARRDRSIADLLGDRGWISAEDRSLVEQLLDLNSKSMRETSIRAWLPSRREMRRRWPPLTG